MFGIDGVELLVVAVAALIFIGPQQLPQAMRTVGRWVGRIRAYARHFNAGIESVMREAELAEMEREWREQNARIMAQYPDADTMPPLSREELEGPQPAPPSEAEPVDKGKLP